MISSVLSLFVIIGLGFVAGRRLTIDRKSISALLIYFITPVVVLGGVLRLEYSPALFLLPVIIFLISSLLCFLTLHLSGHLFSSPSKNILAFAAGTANSGYFGLPLAVALFGPQAYGYAVYIGMGFILFESTIGFFVTARGNHNAKDSLSKTLRLPSVYAFLCGILLKSIFQMPPHWMNAFFDLFRGAYSVLGLLLIGLAVSRIKTFALDWRFVGITHLNRFIIWPLGLYFFVWLDRVQLNLFSPIAHQVLLIMGVVPLATNAVAFATELNCEPDKTAMAVIISTAISLLAILLYLRMELLLPISS